MKRFCVCLFAAALFSAVSAVAQTASLTAAATALAPKGGTVLLTATATYDGQPAALGWSIALPADWSLVSVSGPNLPAIAPPSGSAGTLEFAYTSVPNGRAEFSMLVQYPAGVVSATARPTVIVRSGGKLQRLTPATLQFKAVK